MRDIKRIKEICKLLEQAWSKTPDLRFGQFLENFIFKPSEPTVFLFYQEDETTKSELKRFLEKK